MKAVTWLNVIKPNDTTHRNMDDLRAGDDLAGVAVCPWRRPILRSAKRRELWKFCDDISRFEMHIISCICAAIPRLPRWRMTSGFAHS